MKIKTIMVLLIFAVAIIGIIAPVNATVNSISGENKVYTIESKAKTSYIKVYLDSNGGRFPGFTSKRIVKTIKKGSKIGTMPTPPYRSGYTFKGYYTKKTGGKKISKNTRPTKKVVYYTHWKKKKS